MAGALLWLRLGDESRARGEPGHNDGMTLTHRWPWPGNTSSVQHGAYSSRKLGPVAERIVTEILEDTATPRYLVDDGSYRLSLQALGRVEAICYLLWEFVATQLDEHDVRALLEDVTVATEHEQRDGAVVSRRSVSRRVESALNQLRKFEVTALQMRKGLGLDPASRSKMAARILQPQMFDIAMVAAVMAREGDGGDSPDS